MKLLPTLFLYDPRCIPIKLTMEKVNLSAKGCLTGQLGDLLNFNQLIDILLAPVENLENFYDKFADKDMAAHLKSIFQKGLENKKRKIPRPPMSIIPGSDISLILPNPQFKRSLKTGTIQNRFQQTKLLCITYLKHQIYIPNQLSHSPILTDLPIQIGSVPWGWHQ